MPGPDPPPGPGHNTKPVPGLPDYQSATKPEKRWLSAFYLDQPEEWDDPYRFFNW